MAESLKDVERKYTYQDYLKWDEGERWELIDGVPYAMAGPSTTHQAVSMDLARQFSNYLLGKTCRVFAAPYDVRLPEEDETAENARNVIQPDMLIVCDKNKVVKHGCIGAPDLIIEIVSPSTFKKDLKEKFNLYERHGVKEYWMVYPDDKTVVVYTLAGNKRYGRPEIYSEQETIKVGIFEDMAVDLKTVFVD